MKDNNDDFRENVYDEYYEEEDTKRKFPSFILLCLITTFGVLTPLGVSLSVFKYFDSNESINSLISTITGGDNAKVVDKGKGKYIITYIENGYYTKDGSDITTNRSLYISDANVSKTTNGGKGEVVYYEGLLLTTNNIFTSSKSTVTYKLTIKNDSPSTKEFNGLIYNEDDDLKYTVTGIKKGDIVKSGEEVTAYLTVEYTGKDTNYPKEIEATTGFSFDKKEDKIHIEDAKYDKSNNGGTGKVNFFDDLILSTETTFTKENSTVTYKVTIVNDSNEEKTYNGIDYDEKGNVNYTITGINEGDKVAPGESVVVYVTVESKNNSEFPATVDSVLEFNFDGLNINYLTNGINLINQFPTKDEVGKLFEGDGYLFKFTLILGSKSAGAYYEITAVPEIDNNLNPNYVKLYLEKNNKGVDFSYKDNGKVKVFTDYPKSEYEEAEGRVIYKGTITESDVKSKKLTFTLRMWVSEDVKVNGKDVNSFNNKKFAVKINTYAANAKG